MSKFPYKTDPYEHQREALRRGATRPHFAYFPEQGTGKSKMLIDNIGYLFLEEKIGAAIIIAPNGVHRNWIEEELPKHMSDAVPYRGFIWKSGRAKTKAFQEEWEDFISEEEKLVVLVMNIEATITKFGRAALKTVLEEYPTLLAIDESTDIKSPSAKRTKALRALGRKADFRRILTGTPSPEGPMDLFAQLNFLSPHLVGNKFAIFKARYGIWVQQKLGDSGRSFPVLTGYQNLDELKRIVDSVSYRVRRDEVLDLPPQIYTKRFFELTAEQWRMYKELRDSFMTSFGDGAEVTAELSMVRMLRLHQISCGYVPPDDAKDEPARAIPGPNPRLDLLGDVLAEMDPDRKAIVWCRFRLDADLICAAFEDYGPCRYDGAVDEEGRAESLRRFRSDPSARIFVANPAAGGRGLTLNEANTVIFYSNYFGLEDRKQAEDRCHRIGQNRSVLYVDLIGERTVDEKIVKALRTKQNLMNMMTGDPQKDWI